MDKDVATSGHSQYRIEAQPVAFGSEGGPTETVIAVVMSETTVEIYKMYVDTAEKAIERRLHTNKYYFSTVAAIFAAYAYIGEGKAKMLTTRVASTGELTQPPLDHILASTLPLLLFIVSISWFMSVLSFRRLSVAKYEVIKAMEEHFPTKPFTSEWRAMQTTRARTSHTIVELVLPVVFSFIGMTVLILSLLFRG